MTAKISSIRLASLPAVLLLLLVLPLLLALLLFAVVAAPDEASVPVLAVLATIKASMPPG